MPGINGRGTLYDASGKQTVAVINYRISEKPPTEYTLGEWHGDFSSEDKHLFIQGEYVIELQDKRKGKIIIANINIQSGASNYYRFQGSGPLK